MTFLTSSLLKLPIKFDIARHLYDVICINELTHRVLQLVIAQHRIRLKLLCPVSIMKIFLSGSSLLFSSGMSPTSGTQMCCPDYSSCAANWGRSHKVYKASSHFTISLLSRSPKDL